MLEPLPPQHSTASREGFVDGFGALKGNVACTTSPLPALPFSGSWSIVPAYAISPVRVMHMTRVQVACRCELRYASLACLSAGEEESDSDEQEASISSFGVCVGRLWSARLPVKKLRRRKRRKMKRRIPRRRKEQSKVKKEKPKR